MGVAIQIIKNAPNNQTAIELLVQNGLERWAAEKLVKKAKKAQKKNEQK